MCVCFICLFDLSYILLSRPRISYPLTYSSVPSHRLHWYTSNFRLFYKCIVWCDTYYSTYALDAVIVNRYLRYITMGLCKRYASNNKYICTYKRGLMYSRIRYKRLPGLYFIPVLSRTCHKHVSCTMESHNNFHDKLSSSIALIMLIRSKR